jgi:hypothetical protein
MDGGATWNPDLNNGMIVAFNRATRNWTMFKTADGGKSWSTTSLVKVDGGGTCFIYRDMSLITIYSIPEKKILLMKQG